MRGLASLVALASLALVRPAAAHVAASVDDNNRYLKLSLMGDRVRLAYTIFFGEVPGKAMRPAIDTNRNGRLDPDETDTFAARLGAEVEAQLRVVLDGVEQPVRFELRSLGTLSEAVSGGSFSVDLITTLCTAPAARHQLELRDRFTPPRPGETEIYLEDGPGISVTEATVGDPASSAVAFRFDGPVPALADPGLRVAYQVAADAAGAQASRCSTQRAGREGDEAGRGPLRWALPLGAALLAFVSLWRWRQRRRLTP